MKSEESLGDALEGWLGKEEELGGLGTFAGGSVEAPDPPIMMTFGWMMGRGEVGRLEDCLGTEDGEEEPGGLGTLAGGSVEAPNPPDQILGWMMGREEFGRLEECLGKDDSVGAERRDPVGFATSLEALVLVCGISAGGSQTVSHSSNVGEAWDKGPAGEGEV